MTETNDTVFYIDYPTLDFPITRGQVDSITKTQYGRKTTDEEWKWVMEECVDYIYTDLMDDYSILEDRVNNLIEEFLIDDEFEDRFFSKDKDE